MFQIGSVILFNLQSATEYVTATYHSGTRADVFLYIAVPQIASVYVRD